MLTTTLQKLKNAGACVERYKHLREFLGKSFGMASDLPLTRILEANGLDDCLWALDRAVEGGDKVCRLFGADCAEHVQHIWLKHYPNDKRPQQAIAAARQFARGQITDAAWAAATTAARAAVRAAAGDAAWDAAWDAVRAAAGDAEEKWQTERLISYINEEVTEDWHAENTTVAK